MVSFPIPTLARKYSRGLAEDLAIYRKPEEADKMTKVDNTCNLTVI